MEHGWAFFYGSVDVNIKQTSLTHTKQNECCAILIDQDFASHDICYLFFKMTNK